MLIYILSLILSYFLYPIRYVYYEGDCFFNHLNPYIPVNAEELSQATTMKQNFLKDVPQARIDACYTAKNEFVAMFQGNNFNPNTICNAYSQMNKEIIRERKRLGGDWAISQAVPTRQLRDHIRSELGPDLTFVVLHMTKEDQKKRINSRQGNGDSKVNDFLMKAFEFYEPAAKDEINTIDLRITPEMSPDDVVSRVLEIIEKQIN